MAKPKLIADEALMLHLRNHRNFPKVGFRIKIPKEEMANLLFTYYIDTVYERGRSFVRDEHLESIIWKLSEILTEPSYRFGIILSGPCGNGKTTMMMAIRKTIHHLYSKQCKAFIDYPGFCTSIPIESAKDIISKKLDKKNFVEYDMLMIDDLGHEPTEVVSFGMIYTPLIDLLESRYARQKYTIISTNLRDDEIRPKYKNRIADRFNEMMHFVKFESRSYRE